MVGSYDAGEYYFNNNCSSAIYVNRTIWFEIHTPYVLTLEISTSSAALITVHSGTCSKLQCVGCSTGGNSSYCYETKFTTYDTSYYVSLSGLENSLFYDLNIAVKELVLSLSCSNATSLNLPLYTQISTYFTTVYHAVTINDACYGPSYQSPTYWTLISVNQYSATNSSAFQLSVDTCLPKTQINTRIEVVSACSGGYCYAKSAKCNGSTVLVNLYYGSYYVGISSGNSTTGYVSATFFARPLGFEDIQESNGVALELAAPQDVSKTQKSKKQ